MRKRAKKRRRKLKKWVKATLSLIGILVVVVVFLHISANHKPSTTKTLTTSLASSQSAIKASSKTTSETASKTKWLKSKAENELPILMFHYVTSRPDELPQDSNNIPIQNFEDDLKTLHDNGYTTLSGSEAEKVITQKEKPSNKMVWLTFDDGSVTLYTEIFPLLKKYNMHATGFIITGFVDNNQGGILTWAQIKEMKASGLVDFGSHTVDHPDLSTLSDDAQQTELANSKADLDKELNQNTNIICYPAGGYNQDTLNIAQNLGYKFGLLDPGRNGAVATSAQASDGLLTLPRLRMMGYFTPTPPQDMMSMIQPATDYNEKN